MGENDAHPLTDEQLDALVDEIQERLGDSTARKYGRRGVLAALGLATLGTGSASAQASGTVGTSSSPVDVFGYDVDASNSFTDPAGVQHTGELADLSDVGGAAGQWQEVNSGSNIEPIDGETIGTGTEDVDVGTLSTDPTTMFVRSTGSDSNDGLSTGDAKATIQSAIKDAPLTPNGNSLIIDVGDGTYPGVDMSELSVSHVEIEGNGKTNTTIDGTAGTTKSHAINCSNQPRTVVRDCSLLSGSGGCFRVWMGELVFNNVDASSDQADGADHCGQINQSGYFNDGSNCTYTHDGDGSSALINVVRGAAQFLGASYTGTGSTDKIIRVKEGGEAQVIGSTIKGAGPATTGFGILSRHNSSVKVQDVTVEDVSRAFSRSDSGQFRVIGTNTLTNTNVRYGGTGGEHRDTEVGEEVKQLPSNSATPTQSWGKGAAVGNLHYNTNDGHAELYSATKNATLNIGIEVVDTGTDTVSSNGSTTINWTGNQDAGTKHLAFVNIDTAPGADAELSSTIKWDSGGQRQELRVSEELGNTSVDFNYTIVRLPV